MKKRHLLTLTLAMLLFAPAAYAASITGPNNAAKLTILSDDSYMGISRVLNNNAGVTSFAEIVLKGGTFDSGLAEDLFWLILSKDINNVSKITLDGAVLQLPELNGTQDSSLVFSNGDFTVGEINVGRGSTLDASYIYPYVRLMALVNSKVTFQSGAALIVPGRADMGRGKATDAEYSEEIYDILKEWNKGAGSITSNLNVLEKTSTGTDLSAINNTNNGSSSSDTAGCSAGASFIFPLPVLAAFALWKKR